MAQEAKATVGGIRGITNGDEATTAAAAAAAAGEVAGPGFPGSPSPATRDGSSRGGEFSSPPPRTPESRTSSVAVTPASGMVDRRQLFEGNQDSSEDSTEAGTTTTTSTTSNAEMPPPPTTPKARGRRSRSKTPAKRGTPKDVQVMRQGGEGDDGDDGAEEGGEGRDGGDGGGKGEGGSSSLTPSKKKAADGPARVLSMTPTKKKRGAFGRMVDASCVKDRIAVPPSVTRVYSIVQKVTGNIGGNGNSGAIYGELTVGGMQKVVNVLKEQTGFDENSSFIDVGAGLGKPNFHVAQDPGVEISYGLELETVRWELSIANHRKVLLDKGDKGVQVAKHNLFFARGDILSCKTFDPFTHVYMFDIGFPPSTLKEIAKKFNESKARHLVSYQVPKKVMNIYLFDVDLVCQQPLTLTGSGEGHMMYLYRRKKVPAGLKIERIVEVDAFFAEGVKFCRESRTDGGASLAAQVDAAFAKNTTGGVRTRGARRANA